MTTELGTAYVNVMPSMREFGRAVSNGLDGVDTTAAGNTMGQRAARGFAGGMASQGVIIGAASSVANKAFDTIASSMGSAISRVDTMNNFPRIMKNMGVSAKDAEDTISVLSDKLTGLPTTLDSAVASVERFTLKNGDVKKSADMFLAVNDAILAGGTPTMQQRGALEQLSQAYSKGRMDIMEWRTLQQAMPAQLKQVADSMGITVEQLGAGLRSAEKDADFLRTISMDEFIEQIMRLDREGVNGLASFEQQARDSTAGIQTAMDNLNTAVVRGVANMIESIGQKNISDGINFLGSEIGRVFKSLTGDVAAISGFLSDNKAAISGVITTLANIAPVAIRAWGAFMAFKAGKSIFDSVRGSVQNMALRVQGFGESMFTAGVKLETMGVKGGKAMQSIGSAINGLSPGKMLGITAAVSAAMFVVMQLVDAYQKWAEHNARVEKSTTGLETATSRITGILSTTEGKVRDLSSAARDNTVDMEAMWEAQAGHVDEINTIADSAEAEVISLNSAQRAIEELAGKTDLTTQEQGRLSAALDTVNSALGTNYQAVDLANGKISDSAGEYDEAKDAAGEYKDEILKLIDAKKQEVKVEAIQKSLAEAYEGQAEALSGYTQAVSDYNKALEDQANYKGHDASMIEWYDQQVTNADKKMQEAKKSLDGWNSSIDTLESNLGNAAAQAAGTASEFSKFATDTHFEQMLQSTGYSVADFEQRLGEVGISVSDLSGLTTQEMATLASKFDGSGASITNTLSSIRSGIYLTNATQLYDKRAEVSISDGQLLDAQGNVYTWNGTQLLDKDGNVVTYDTELIDSQNRVWVWNGTDLEPRSASVSVEGAGSLETVKNSWDGWNPVHQRLVATVDGTIANVLRGLGLMATGGFIKMHATGGFITNGTTPLGIDRNGVLHVAGEDGREWVEGHADGTLSIVPIENRKYLKPYAETIASMIPAGGGTQISITVNARTGANPDEIAAAISRKVQMVMMARGR